MADTEIGNKLFGAWLRHQRKSRGLTQEELGAKALCSRDAISKIEVGERRPSRQLAELLAAVLGVPEEEEEAFIRFARATPPNDQQALAWQHIAASEAPWRLNPPSQALVDSDSPNNLPAPLTRFIGRERELRQLGERLLHGFVRLLTLTGPPGVGKTRLSLELARRFVGEFEHGVFLVELAPLRDPALVLSAVASALDVREMPGEPLFETLKTRLRDRHTLLVLDNFEHLPEAAPLVSKLLERCPGLKVLATSREPLYLYAEHRFEVPPLQLPDPQQAGVLSPQALGQYEAVMLFEERARAILFDFAVTNDNAQAIAEICRQLEGVPLAVELAVANLGTESPQGIVSGIRTHLRSLQSSAGDLPDRHRTLQGAIAWSYDLLSEPEKRVFGRLAVFLGGCSVDAAVAICEDHESHFDVPAALLALASKSLLFKQRDPYEPGGFRFSMLETIRQYAHERAIEPGEVEELSRRHAHFFTTLVEEGRAGRAGSEITGWYNYLEKEHNNLRAALAWLVGPSGESETAQRLATALGGFWATRGHLAEAQRWLTLAVAAQGEVSARVRAAALHELAYIHWRQGHAVECAVPLQEALELYRATGDKEGVASCLLLTGQISLLPGSHISDPRGDEQALLDQSLSLFREINNQEGALRALGQLGELARAEGRYQDAGRFYDQAISLAEEMGWKDMVSIQFHNLGHVAAHEEDYRRAADLFTRSLAMACGAKHTQLAALGLLGLAGVAGACKDAERAAILFGAGDHLLDSVGATLNRPDRLEYDHNLALAYSQLDRQVWDALYSKGREMRPEQAADYAAGDNL